MWRAHESCALVVPETWVDEVPMPSDPSSSSTTVMKRMVFGVDVVSKDRWNLKCAVCQKLRHKSHGAPIQCTKGKCPKAFHISCAKNDPEHRIQFSELREVQKDVVLNRDSCHPVFPSVPIADSSTMEVEVTGMASIHGMNMPQVTHNVKTIRKIEYELLCPQHNPAVAAAKKASKQDRVRNELLKLPEMARIKLRVTSGVFEVSLLRVIEDRNAVEVLWDGGVRKEFSWNSVVWGKAGDGQIGQKPSVMTEQRERPSSLSLPHSSPFSSIAFGLGTRPSPLPSTEDSSSSRYASPEEEVTLAPAFTSHSSFPARSGEVLGRRRVVLVVRPKHLIS